MRILLVSETYPPSVNGAAYFTQRLGQALQRRGNEVFVMTPSDSFHSVTSTDSAGVTVFRLRSIPILVYPLRITPAFLSGRLVRRMTGILAPDIIHIQNHLFLGRSAFAAARAQGIPVIGTNHFIPETLTVHCPLPALVSPWLTGLLWKHFASLYDQLDLVTAPTRTAAELTRAAGLRRPVLTISNGIELERFKPDNDGRYLRDRYRIPDRPVLLFVGRLDPEKRVDVILRALPLILRQCDVHVVLAGTGTLRAKLERLARKLGVASHVTFTGFVPDEDLPSLYRIASVFVMAGNAELQSIATMEAMASGLPIVAVDAQALPELVHHGENGLLCPEDRCDRLAVGAASLLRDEQLRRRFAERSLQLIQAHDLGHVAMQFECLYERVLSWRAADQEVARREEFSYQIQERSLAATRLG
jgi:glycosyltransferase involved in cell wall biosynthesis